VAGLRPRAAHRAVHGPRAGAVPGARQQRGARHRLPAPCRAHALLHLRQRTAAVIEVRALAKRFGTVQAVRGVSFTALDGRITGLLGPNGAGKSTTLRLLYTVLKPDAGDALIDGLSVLDTPLDAARRLGVLPHSAGIYPNLSARENILYFAALQGLTRREARERTAALLQLLEMQEFADRRAKGFSQGERMKTALARS